MYFTCGSNTKHGNNSFVKDMRVFLQKEDFSVLGEQDRAGAIYNELAVSAHIIKGEDWRRNTMPQKGAAGSPEVWNFEQIGFAKVARLLCLRAGNSDADN